MKVRQTPTALAAALGAAALAACAPTPPEIATRGAQMLAALPVIPVAEAPAAETLPLAPPGANPALCWARDTIPAVIETDERTRRQTGADGRAFYATDTIQRIVTERQELWFETPCPPQMDERFTASLQRALKARGHFGGRIDGTMSPATHAAIRAYQAPQGLNSAVLSMEAARRMGLVQVERTDMPMAERTDP